MNLSGSRVLVTGAGGFIGSHLVERLADCGARVTALVHYNSSNRHGWLDEIPAARLKDVEIVAGDIQDPGAMADLMAGKDVVFHLAALIAIPHSYASPRCYLDTNVLGTQNLLEAARRHRVVRFLHTSTSEVYGTAQAESIDESHPVNAQSPYAASKAAADQLVLSYGRSFALPVVVVRPFNTYGPRQSARAVIPTIASQAIESDVVRLGALHPLRDLTFVEDTVSGFLAAALSEAVLDEVVNLGTGRSVSIGDLASMVIAAVGSRATVEVEERRLRPEQSEVLRLRCDPGKARRLLGWAARIPLEEGLRRTVEWIRANRGSFRPSEYVR